MVCESFLKSKKCCGLEAWAWLMVGQRMMQEQCCNTQYNNTRCSADHRVGYTTARAHSNCIRRPQFSVLKYGGGLSCLLSARPEITHALTSQIPFRLVTQFTDSEEIRTSKNKHYVPKWSPVVIIILLSSLFVFFSIHIITPQASNIVLLVYN